MHLRTTRRPAAASLLLLALALAGLLLAGCGSSSSTTTKNASALASATAPGAAGSAGASGPSGASGSTGTTGSNGTTGPNRTTGPSGASGPTGAPGTRFKALRECLQKQGITLPTRPQGTRKPGERGGLFGGGSGTGGPKLPNGVTRQKFQEALQKCSAAGGLRGGRFRGVGTRLNSPAFHKTLASFAACMNEHGVKLPAPNTSGKGPVFDTKGINTQSATFQKAAQSCRSKVHLFFPGAGGAPPAPESGAAPGAPGAPGAPEGAPPAE